MKKRKEICMNCGGDQTVPVLIPCPNCKASGYIEIDELRKLAKWIDSNFRQRSRPPAKGIELLNRVLRSQNKPDWW